MDPNRRVLTWEGIPGERGCRQRLETPFGNVRAVRDEPVGLVRLEIKGQPRDRWMFVPLPHAAWLAQPASALSGGMSKEVARLARRPRRLPAARWAAPRCSRGRSSGRASCRGRSSGDVRLAVERIREVLGRTPAPSVELHEALSGRPVEVSIADAARERPALSRAVRCGCAGSSRSCPTGRGSHSTTRDGRLGSRRSRSSPTSWRPSCRDWKGQEVEVAGVLRRRAASAADAPSHEVVFWEYLGPETASATAEVRTATIRDLVQRPTDFAGQTVRVVGRFRGHDVDRSLPPPRPRGAWAIKAGRHAIWVTGHKPSGRGFTLHPELEADTHKWLEVVGRLEVQDGACRLRASAVGLSAPASFVGFGKRLVGALAAGGRLHAAARRRGPGRDGRALPRPVQRVHGRGELRGTGAAALRGRARARRATCRACAGRTTTSGAPSSSSRASPCGRAPPWSCCSCPASPTRSPTPLGSAPGADAAASGSPLRWRVEG